MVSPLEAAKPALQKVQNTNLVSIGQHGNDASDQSEKGLLQRHRLGVRPGGNALTSDQDLSLSMGIFGRIPDALLLLLLEYLEQTSLVNLSRSCKGLFAYATNDQLWREVALRDEMTDFQWTGTWRSSLLQCSASLPLIDCQHLYSDALYRPFQCTHTSLNPFTSHIPRRNEITRFPDMSTIEFTEGWSDTPFILSAPVKKWQVYRDWDERFLLREYGDIVFRAEAVDWTLNNYVRYMNDNQDESPLYLFDRAFVQKMNLQVGTDGAYQAPECFEEDLFTLLGEHRPDHRWLIIGPERSGSTFHKDPNATSAWNAVIRGSKYWIMFPNSITPPGVYVSNDQSEVTSPLSIAEWMLSFHEEARQTPGCVEGICGPGEVLHVPSGWWHLVVNLEPAIAITQNFVPRSHLWSAVNFLKNKADQVSGFRSTVSDPYTLFMDRLKEEQPRLYQVVQDSGHKKRKWEDVVAIGGDENEGGRGFSFGFREDLNDEEGDEE